MQAGAGTFTKNYSIKFISFVKNLSKKKKPRQQPKSTT